MIYQKFYLVGLAWCAWVALGWSQQPRPYTELGDPNAIQAPSGWNTNVAGEGANRVVIWGDDRFAPGEQDLFVSFSTNHGLTWGPEIQLTDAATTGKRYREPWIVIEDGVVHVAYTDFAVNSTHRLLYRRSTDLGASWSTPQVLVDSMRYYQMAVDGDDVVLAWVNNALTSICSRWSDNAGFSFAPEIPVDQLNQGSYSMDHFSIDVGNGLAHMSFVSTQTGDTDVWYAQARHSSQFWFNRQRVDQAQPGEGLPIWPKVGAANGSVHISWVSSDRPTQGIQDPSSVMFYVRSVNHGLNWTGEQKIGDYPTFSTVLFWGDMTVDNDTVAIHWTDYRSQPGRRYLSISTDGGQNFGPDVVSQSVVQSSVIVRSQVAIEGDTIAFHYTESRQHGGQDLWIFPMLMISADRGQNWSSPMNLEPGITIGEEARSDRFSVDIQDDSVLVGWGLSGAQGKGVRVGGLRLPVIEFIPRAGGALNKVALRMSFVDSSRVGSLARWAASSVNKEVVHPENPSLELQLGPSGIYNQSLAKAAVLTRVVQADGTAETNPIPIKPSLIGKTLYFQGWVNENGLGSTPSDVIRATIQ